MIFNTLNFVKDEKLFNEFKEYAIQDAVCLYEALYKAQQLYLEKY